MYACNTKIGFCAVKILAHSKYNLERIYWTTEMNLAKQTELVNRGFMINLSNQTLKYETEELEKGQMILFLFVIRFTDL